MNIDKLNNKDWLEREYVEGARSTKDIAEELGTNKQRVRRALHRLGIPVRTASEAQLAALESGRAKHPTLGTQRPEHTRLKIAEGVYRDWANADEATLKARSDRCKRQWENTPQAKKDEMLKKAHAAVRESAKEGSQLERFVREGLTDAGYKVDYHVKGLVPNENLEVDLFLPELSTAIEIDGPSHFFPIWGDEKLQKNISSDIQKNGLLLNQGLVVVRVRQLNSFIGKFAQHQVLVKIIETLKSIEQQFPSKHDRMIEVDVQ